VKFVKKPKQPYPSPGQDLSPTLPRWFGNQRSHQNKDPWQKQNPGNNSKNRCNFPWSRQNKTTTCKPFKPLTCFYCRKDGHMIFNCLEKLKMAQQQHNPELIAKQHKDTELASLFARVVNENEVSQNPVYLFTKNRALMR